MLSTLRFTLYSALAGACAISGIAQQSLNTPAAKASKNGVAMTDAELRNASEYWTPERLAGARPLALPTLDPEQIRAESALNQGKAIKAEPLRMGSGGRPTPGLRPSLETKSEERFPLSQNPVEANSDLLNANPDTVGFNYEMPFDNYRTGINNTYPYTTIGKLFFTIPQGASEPAGDYVCSASVAIDSHTVVTARHCMFDYATSKWYSNWSFYPGWNNGADPTLHNSWLVNFAYTWTSNAASSDYDIGLFSMHDGTGKGCGGDSGRTIGQWTGWLGYSYGGDFSQRQWNIFGYPQDAPFEGNYLYQDNAATGALNTFGTTDEIEVGNPQTGGTSGGPWIIGFDPNDGTVPSPNNNTNPGDDNLINSVNSFKWTRPAQPFAINGPAFESYNFWNLYTGYQKLGCQ